MGCGSDSGQVRSHTPYQRCVFLPDFSHYHTDTIGFGSFYSLFFPFPFTELSLSLVLSHDFRNRDDFGLGFRLFPDFIMAGKDVLAKFFSPFSVFIVNAELTLIRLL